MAIRFNSQGNSSKGFYTKAGGFEASVNGNDLLKALKQFPKNIQKNVMVGATRAAANVVRDEARRLVPKRTKNLQKSIKTVKRSGSIGFNKFSTKGSNPNFIQFSVTPVKGSNQKYDGWYAHMVEFGTVHQAAQPFMRRAFEQSNNESLEASKKYIAERIPKELAKAKA